MERVAIAIVGCGSFGSYLSRIMKDMPKYQIVAVCDPLEESSVRLGKELGVPAFVSFEQCLSESPAEAVALFTPNHLHAPQAIAAAQAGKHIFCEKPMARTVEECYQMMEAAEQAGVRLMVGHKRRLRPQYIKIAEIVRGQRFGRMLSVNINGFHFRELQGWWTCRESGGGLLPNSGVHDIDFLRSICGEAASVFARSPVKTDHRTDFEDALSMLVHFESGVVASLQVCPFFPNATFRQSFGIQIVFERGGLVYDPKQMVIEAQGWNELAERFEFDNEAGFLEAYHQELNSFAGWVLQGRPPLLTAWDGLRCVEIMQAAQLSAYNGKEVQLPMPRHEASRVLWGPGSWLREMATPRLYASGLSMPEGPAFDSEGFLFVANCRANFVSKISPSGQVQPFVTTGGKTQGVAIHPDGSLLITDILKQKIFRATADGSLCDFCVSYADGSPLRGPNEIAFGPNGQVYFTDPGEAWRGRKEGALSRITETCQAEVLIDGLEFTNGLDFSPDGKILYLAESTTGRILCGELGKDGRLNGTLTECIRFDGRVGPDGIRVSANGNLYVTLFGHGQVAVVSPAGEVIDLLRVPGLFPTNAIFLGTDLLVCEGQTGAIWRLAVEEEGIPSYAQRTWQAAKKAWGSHPVCSNRRKITEESP